MAVSLGPGKFYGTSLPRPRIYNDVKFNDERVDPPVPVTDSLMSWADEAHWSMGGLSFKRLRLQGKIEGNVNKLRAEREKLFKKQNRGGSVVCLSDLSESKRGVSISPPPAPLPMKRRRFMALIEEEEEEGEEEIAREEGSLKIGNRWLRRSLVKKLGDEFDRVASDSEKSDMSDIRSDGKKLSPVKGSSGYVSDSMMMRTTRSLRSERSDDVDVVMAGGEVNKSNSKGKKLKAGKKSKSEGEKSPVPGNGVRTSPRLAKQGSN